MKFLDAMGATLEAYAWARVALTILAPLALIALAAVLG